MPKESKSIDDYIVVAIPENPYVYGIQRHALPEERFLKCKDDVSPQKEVYDSVMHIVSPYVNYYTGEKTESCSCISWRTRKKRCIHLKAFYKKNPHMDKAIKIKENSKDLKEIRRLIEIKTLGFDSKKEDNK
jgi:hypothetical protein